MAGLWKRITCEKMRDFGAIHITCSNNQQFAVRCHEVFLMIRLVFWSRSVACYSLRIAYEYIPYLKIHSCNQA